MSDLKQNANLIVEGLAALILTGLAAYSGQVSVLSKETFLSVPQWIIPLAYFAVALLFERQKMNRPVSALISVAACVISGVLLFAPIPGIQWYYPLGISLILVFFVD